jgi:hypothetical protein
MNDLTIMDWATAERRPATQEDIDKMQNILFALSCRSAPVNDDVPDDADFGFLLAMYPNPMRNDGVFVSELKHIEPYHGITGMQGEAVFPAIPETPYRIGTQLPRKFAKELVRRWNAFSAKGHT